MCTYYIYMCVYVYAHDIYTSRYVCVHITYICVYMYVHIISIHRGMYVYIFHIYMYICKCTYLNLYVYTHYTYMCVYMHIYQRVYICTGAHICHCLLKSLSWWTGTLTLLYRITVCIDLCINVCICVCTYMSLFVQKLALVEWDPTPPYSV